MTAQRLIISGAVQGVGFRDWLAGTARRLDISGWVRNLPDGTVEALLSGSTDAVEECARACRRGPPLAVVQSITETLADPPAELGFHKRPTPRTL
jgi:acylphosphatase